jgi:hypothetical protein
LSFPHTSELGVYEKAFFSYFNVKTGMLEACLEWRRVSYQEDNFKTVEGRRWEFEDGMPLVDLN